MVQCVCPASYSGFLDQRQCDEMHILSTTTTVNVQLLYIQYIHLHSISIAVSLLHYDTFSF